MVIFDRLKVLTAARYKKANGSNGILFAMLIFKEKAHFNDNLSLLSHDTFKSCF
jgi:hypothetical protein